MPRYLGINYWQSKIEERREFYSRALLLVPHHLHEEDSAKRFKSDQQVLNEDQWKVCRDAGPFADITVTEGLDILRQLKNVTGSISETAGRIPEMYDRRTEFHLIHDHVAEVVPSSNPESLDSFLSDELFEPFDTFDDTKEVFEKEDLSKYGDKKEKDKLENVLLSDGLKDTCSNIPKLSSLIHCLQSRSVKDPLADEDGKMYSEVLTFKEHFKVEGEESVLQSSEEMPIHLEVFDKYTYSDYKAGELEDVILPPCRPGGEDRVNSMLDIHSHVKTCVSREAEEQCEDKNDDVHLFSDAFTPAAEVEEPEFTGISSLHSVDFLSLSDLGVDTKDGRLESRAMLESPLLPCGPPEMHAWNLSDQLQELKPASPGIDTTQTFLRQFEKEALLTKVWEHEKFFDEVLALRLPEPDVAEEHFPDHTSITDLVSQLQLVEESGLGSVELQLRWDPWLSCRALMTRMLQVEHADFGSVSFATSVLNVAEEFVKYTNSQLFVDADNHADIPTVTLQEDGLGNTPTHDKAANPPEITEGKANIDMMKASLSTRADGQNLSKVKPPAKINQISRPAVTNDHSFTGFSPLDEFLMMRSSTITKHLENVHTDKASASKQAGEHNKDIAQRVEEAVPRKAICKTVDVQLSGPYKQVFHALHSFGRPYVDVLKQAGEIPHHASMFSLKLDSTRFLVKQQEKEQQDKQTEGGDVYKSMVVVYAVVGAVDLLVHCCLESAIRHLSAVQEKYHSTLGGSMESIRKELFQFKVSFDQDNVLHPKVGILCKNIEETVKRSPGDSKGNKVLVVTKRNLPSLMCYLEKALSVCGDICPYFVKTLEGDTYAEVENHNCVIISESALNKDTKWDMFGLVIEFETDSNSSACRKCQDVNVNYLGLKGDLLDLKAQETQKVHSMQMKKSSMKVTVIGSVNVTSQKNLLQLLESRHNIAVIERDNSDSDSRPSVDVIVDERHCVVLHSLLDISDEWQVEHLSRKLVVLGLQFTYCWVIFYSTAATSTGYLLPNAVVANICKLEAALANLNSNTERFQVTYKLLIAYNLVQLAATVRTCCDKCVEMSTVWTKQQWTRPWISGEASRDEKFLTSLQCLNSFSAQLLLSRTSIGSLLSCTLPQLQQIAPELPEKVHLMFHKKVNCDTGLHLRSDDTVNMESQPRANPTQAPNRQTDTSCQASAAHDHLHQGLNMTSRNSYQTLKEIQIPRFSDVEFLTTQPHPQGCSTPAIPCFRQEGLSEDPFFRLVEQYPTQSSLSQDTNDSPGNSQGYTKPNEYVLAKIEGMAENEARQFEEIVTPDFNLLGDADIQRARSSKELHMINQTSLSDALRPRKVLSRANMYVNGDQDILSGFSVQVPNKKPSFSSVLRAKVNSKNRFMHEFNQSNSFDEVSPSSTQISQSHQSNFFPEKSIRESYQGPSYVDGSLLDIPKTHGLPRTDAGVSHTCVDLGRSMLPRCHERRPPLHSISDGRWPDFTNGSSTVTKSLLGRPAFSEHFQSSLLKPPVQRVSIGLAQPLRRDTQQEEVQRAAQATSGWMNYDSPPMDMEPDSPYQGASIRKEHPYSYRQKYQNQDPSRMFQAEKEQGEDVNYLLEAFPNKRKKLTYKPLPGRSRGQTVLAFR
ncbi:protein shortage in chiasmata 1 ortholog-like isoform X1 [Haliotis rufescens]|uniref:protein shortage in chiasmata 1 ortholog-like isoform X1 n=1 Tax=Haliotis rufescens TaxID=6454 RepID=UPI00201F354F|nr:protein shortage in chiasmata 1 ortholog-like isoform X1 [Haliotis rufescens]